MPRVAVVVFPGSNCEQDVVYALRREGADADLVWHADTDLGGADAVVLPGGFAHGVAVGAWRGSVRPALAWGAG